MVVTEELRTPLGVLLARSLRSVLSWAATPPARRGELFTDGGYERRTIDLLEAETPPAIVEACEVLTQLLAGPATAQPDAVAGSCVAIANWARHADTRGTRLAFLAAAARCCPHNASLPLMVGREARDQGLYAVSMEWLARAAMVSRSAGEWEVYARAHVAYGNVMIARGSFAKARRHLLRAERSASRHGLVEVRAMAHHDLFVVDAECGDLEAAHRSARAALRAYAAADPRRVNLAFDLAFVWMRDGYFEPALPVFRSLLPRVEKRFLPHLYGAIARAAGACGMAVDYEQAIRVLDGLEIGSGSAEARLDSAHGAISLARWAEADRHAEMALSIAGKRNESKIELLAERLIESIAQRSGRSLTPVVETGADVRELSFDLAASLSGWTAASAA